MSATTGPGKGHRFGPVPYQNGPTDPIPQPLSCQTPFQSAPGPRTLPLPQISVTTGVTAVYNMEQAGSLTPPATANRFFPA